MWITSVKIRKGVKKHKFFLTGQVKINLPFADSVTIPEGVTSIGRWAFGDCSSLHAVIVPKSVTSIGAYAFDDCEILKDGYYRGSEEDWNKISIDYYNLTLRTATIYYNFTDSKMPEIHTGTVWKSDIENHWRECRCGNV